MPTSGLKQRLDAYASSHTRRSVRTGRGAFEYTIGGDGDRAVILLHGGGSTAEATFAFATALAPDFRVIAIDWPDTVSSVDDVLEGILAVAHHEGLQRFSLLGFSMGGMLAQRLAAAQPERVVRLVLMVSMGPSARFAKRFRRYRFALSLIPAGWLAAASKNAVTKWVSEASAGVDPNDVQVIAAQRRAMFDSGRVSKRSLLSDAEVLVDYFSHPFSPPELETLIVEGSADRMVDEAERAALKASYPRAQVITLPQSDHFSMVTAPEALTTAIATFLRGGR